jgi:hypothetical protein
MNSTSAHVAVASTLGGSLVCLVTWIMSIHNLTPPADVVVALTTLANGTVAVLTSVIMKRINP